MPTYKNVSDQTLDWVTTGHMEPGEIKSVADELSHPFLERVDDNEATALQATEPSNDQAPVQAQLAEPTLPQSTTPPNPAAATPAAPAPGVATVVQPAPQPAAGQPIQPAVPTNVTPAQGA